MIRRCKQVLGNERGGVLVCVALSLGVVLGMSALAIDLGMLYTARSEAQRAADAAALAGASAFQEYEPNAAVPYAENRANEYAMRNAVRNVQITAGDIDQVLVQPNLQRVTVTIRRRGIGLWFARILGFNQATVAAQATAEAIRAGEATCVKPFAMPDIWFDDDDDRNRNRVWDFDPVNWNKQNKDQTEIWGLGSSPNDRYQVFTGPDGDPQETGYGSTFRNGWADAQGRTYTNDLGRQIIIKQNDPAGQLGPGNFYPIDLNPKFLVDPLPAQCSKPGGGTTGGATYRANICACNNQPIELGVEYPKVTEPGNKIGPTHQGMEDLIAQDPGAEWDETTKSVKNSSFGENWRASPRVVKVPMADPTQDFQGKDVLVFNNFALLFIEGVLGNAATDPVTARFLYYAPGTKPNTGTSTGSLTKTLRLVK